MPYSSVTCSFSSHYKSTLASKLESVVIPLSGDTKTGAAQHRHTSRCSTPTYSKEQGPSAAPRIRRVQGKLVKIDLILNISAQTAEFAMSSHKKRLFTSKHFKNILKFCPVASIHKECVFMCLYIKILCLVANQG